MRSDIGGVLLNGDPKLVPNGWIKRDDIGTVALTKVYGVRNRVAVEFIKTETCKTGRSIGWISSGSVRCSCQ